MTRKLITAFAGDQSGAVAAYLAILMAVLVGFVGLAVDFGRYYTTHSQASAAADAAAMAAATQLDGQPDAITRATIAAMTTPLVNNGEDFAEGDAIVQIVQLRFLKSLPPSDDDPITNAYVTTNATKAAFVEATTETLNVITSFLAAVGVSSSDTLATAVAGGKNSVQCLIPPLMICNPWEDAAGGSSMSVDDLTNTLVGVTLLAKTQEGGIDSWAPGAMALVDPAPTCLAEEAGVCTDWDTSTNNGTKAVTLALARVPQQYCFPNMPISVRTGQASAMRSAVNSWFDIYDNPFLGGNKYRTDPDYRPAENVTKGWITEWVDTPLYEDPLDPTLITGYNTVCDATREDDPTVAMGLPPDDCFATVLDYSNPVSCGTDSVGPAGSEARIGSGNWATSRIQYMLTNHAADNFEAAAAAAVTAALGGGGPLDGVDLTTRYGVYRAEIALGMIPNQDNLATPDTVEGENGNPICYAGGVGPNADPDRRKLSVAVINCIEYGITGNSVPSTPAEYFAEMFVIRAIAGQSDGNIWLEFISFKEGGSAGYHDIVQLYR